MAAVALLIAIAALIYVTARVHDKLSRSWLWVKLWRWFSGRALDGRDRTDATWLHRSTGTLHPVRVVRWHHMPRLYRAVIRTAGTAAPFAVIAAYRSHPFLTAVAAVAVIAALNVAGGWLAWRKLRHARHEWRYVRPLRRTLTPVLEGAPPRLQITTAPRAKPVLPFRPSLKPQEWTWYRSRPLDATSVKVWLPPEFIGSDKEWSLIEGAVIAKTGLEAPERETKMLGSRPYVTYSKSEPPPAKVTFCDIRSAIAAAAEHEVILGIGKKDQLIDFSLDTEIPHIGFCMETGGGKSKAAMNLSAQVLYHGGIVVFLDNKLMSHMWARGLPNVAYAGTPKELHTMLCWLANDTIDQDGEVIADSELGRRKKVALAAADIRGQVLADIGPRIVVICEELNDTQKMLKKYWRAIGGKGPSPAAEALESIHFAGRQLRMHAVDIGQRLSAKATSSGNSADSRENIGAILFYNPTASTWKMLCDGHVQPPASSHKGRYQLVTRHTVRELQGALWDEQEARDFATAGTVAVPRYDMPLVATPGRLPVLAGQRQLVHGTPEQGVVVGHEPLVPLRPHGSVTLREAYQAGMFPSVDAARKAAQRRHLAPVGEEGRAHLFMISDLAARKG